MKDCLLHCQSSKGSSCGGAELLQECSGPVYTQSEPHSPLLRTEQLPVLFPEHISSTKHRHYICRIQSREVRSLVLGVSVLDYMIWIH